MLRILLLACAISFIGCITDPKDCEKAEQVVVRDTVVVEKLDTVTVLDTVFLVDRPKEAGELDPPALRGTRVVAGNISEITLYIDTVPGAIGYKFYASTKESSGYFSLGDASFTSGYSNPGNSADVPEHSGKFYYRGTFFYRGGVYFLRATSISQNGIESKLSDYKAIVVN